MRALLAQARVEITLTLRRGESLLVSMILPAAILFFMSAVGAGSNRGIDSLLSSTISIAVIGTAMVGVGIATGYERYYGVLKRLGATPLGRTRLLAAKAASAVAVEVVQVILLVILAAALGWRTSPGGIDPAGIVTILFLGTLCFAGIGLSMAGSLRAETNLAVCNVVFLVFLLLSGVIVAVTSLPGPLQTLARALPAGRLSELAAWAIGVSSFPPGAFGILVGWTLASMAFASATFSWD